MSQPPTVLRIGLVSLAGLHVLWVRQYHSHAMFQDVEDRLPIGTGTFNCYVRAGLLDQPKPQFLQIRIGCSVRSLLSSRIRISSPHHDASHQERLSDVYTCAALDYCLNHTSYPPFCRGRPMSKPRHCSTGYNAPIGGTCTSAGSVCISGCDHQSQRESKFLDSMSVGRRSTRRRFSSSGVAKLVMKVCIGSAAAQRLDFPL